jgi:hypothetical protein
MKFCVLCRLPSAILEVAKAMVLQKSGSSVAAAAEKEAGWMLIAALMSSMPKQVAQTFYLRPLVSNVMFLDRACFRYCKL